MRIFLLVSLSASVLGHSEHDFQRWAKNKALESCWGKENMKTWTVQMKKAVAKCTQQDAPELLLTQFRAPHKTVNALLEASDNMENSDMQMMFKMFKFMFQMNQNQQRNSNNQFRPYSQQQDNMPLPMKWMMKMMMKKNNMEQGGYADNYDSMEDLFKYAFNSKTNNDQSNYMKNGYVEDMFDMKNSDMAYGNMFNQRQRHARAAAKDLELGDRLVEKLQGQKQEMEEKIGNLTCILREVNVLNANNELSIFAMKKDLEQYEMPSQWFKESNEALIDTCYELATTLPADLEDGYIVEGEFGKVNMAQVKSFMQCCSKAKAKLCINQDIKQKIEQNFGPLPDILKQSGLTEKQLFPLVQDLIYNQESNFEDLF